MSTKSRRFDGVPSSVEVEGPDAAHARVRIRQVHRAAVRAERQAVLRDQAVDQRAREARRARSDTARRRGAAAAMSTHHRAGPEAPLPVAPAVVDSACLRADTRRRRGARAWRRPSESRQRAHAAARRRRSGRRRQRPRCSPPSRRRRSDGACRSTARRGARLRGNVDPVHGALAGVPQRRLAHRVRSRCDDLERRRAHHATRSSNGPSCATCRPGSGSARRPGRAQACAPRRRARNGSELSRGRSRSSPPAGCRHSVSPVVRHAVDDRVADVLRDEAAARARPGRVPQVGSAACGGRSARGTTSDAQAHGLDAVAVEVQSRQVLAEGLRQPVEARGRIGIDGSTTCRSGRIR